MRAVMVAIATYSSSTVVQRYVQNPMCLNGFKFDLRLYVLVTSFKPLEAFIYTDGFARISTQAYNLNINNFDNKYIHLTNSSIQKQNTAGPEANNPLNATNNDTGGSKISLNGSYGLWQRLKNAGIDVNMIWKQICSMIIKSLVVVNDKMSYQPNAFEVFGYDVLIDKDARPWLIEVNASPSMSRESSLDHRVKNAMIRDSINLVAPPAINREALASILNRRINDVASNKFTLSRSDPYLESDLSSILNDEVPRQYGETPLQMGGYQWLCPNTKLYDSIIKNRNNKNILQN